MASAPRDRSAAIEAFVDRLKQVRENAGRPSFREMARRSGAISHATLHDALQGARMPSWETTVEFARACDTDPEELRPDWERAAAVVRAECPAGAAEEPATPEASGAVPSEAATEATEEPTAASAAGEPGASGESEEPTRPPRMLIGVGAAVVAVVVTVALGVAWATREPPASEAGTTTEITGEAAAAYTSAPSAPSTTTGAKGCPVNADVPAGMSSLVPGDGSDFVDDVTIKDCSTQPRGRTIVKTWSFKNTGKVEWKDRFLHRINAHEGSAGCRAPERVGIPDTAPGEVVEVSVTIVTPEHGATCFGRWMQTDEHGNFTFPEQRSYYYSFRVG